MRPAPERPGLEALLDRSIAAFGAMSPEDQATTREAQRESWVRGNIGIDRGPDARRAIPSAPQPCCGCAERAKVAARVAEHFRVYVAALARNGDARAQRLIEEAVAMMEIENVSVCWNDSHES